jgi:hypothetical protein
VVRNRVDPNSGLARLVSVTVAGAQTRLTIRNRDGRATILWVECLPNPVAAADQTAGVRRLISVRLTVAASGATAQLFAIGGRAPLTRPITVGAALALATSRVPIYVVYTSLAAGGDP